MPLSQTWKEITTLLAKFDPSLETMLSLAFFLDNNLPDVKNNPGGTLANYTND